MPDQSVSQLPTSRTRPLAFEGTQGQQGTGVSSLPALGKAFAAATDPIEKQRLGEDLTRARLAATH
jgi:hypothetical protein